jgi:hypothetical protein
MMMCDIIIILNAKCVVLAPLLNEINQNCNVNANYTGYSAKKYLK